MMLVVFLAGCGSRVAPDADGARVADAPASEIAATEDSTGEPGVEQPATAPSTSGPPSGDATAPAVKPRASASPKFGPKHNNGVVKLALSARCVTPGSLLVVTITGPAKAGLGMVIGYSDHQAHGAMLTGETDAAGRYTWRVPVDPTVPEGDARVLVSATGPNWSQDGGGTADAVFRVAKTGC
jgi:hypothetical protein